MNTTTFTPQEILNSLFLLPVNNDNAKEIVQKNGIVQSFLDFHLAVYAEVNNVTPDVFARAMLTKNFFENYIPGYTPEMIFETAKENTRLKFSPALLELNFFSTFSLPNQMPIFDEHYAIDMSPLNKESVYTLTTKDNFLYGTVNFLNNDVFDIICSRFDSPIIYCACTSVHEIMIHSAESFSPDDIKSILTSTLEEATEDNIKLTDTVYKYTYLKGLEIVA